jgi:hypothetical protein
VKNSHNIIGIGLFDSKGDLIVSTYHGKKVFPNLLENKATASSFLETMNSDHMVLGHTYFNPFFAACL